MVSAHEYERNQSSSRQSSAGMVRKVKIKIWEQRDRPNSPGTSRTGYKSGCDVNQNLNMFTLLPDQRLKPFLLDVFQPDLACYHRLRIEFPCYTVERVSNAVINVKHSNHQKGLEQAYPMK